MLRLLLLRHAKSSWDTANLDDHERPLAKRGTKEAPVIGHLLAARRLRPELVLCSSAVRTRATLTLLLSELPGPPPAIAYDDVLYLAPPDRILSRLAIVEGPRCVMVVGHNPGLHALALSMIGDGDRKDIAFLATRFPTSCLCTIEFGAAHWRDLAPGSGRLTLLATPKRLPDGSR